ncbi:hypothetical protein MGG_08246 [Pyricularia oryzae 70-15]|uniref:Uncharacterized protein n=1 Tax=Pyricularia oryzae (strain 70-15 / ATCC MYA-4617 / FGSC 8958) TaxID=242507 RepID=G5EHX2_PYRO7|nr:uncharacterized protein MGG_12488 [Pyricularia oryzae 70-15]XP_003715841.1 uncharacterized protein MGG_08246 [Pyricularia oryzae 70-15]EHA56032.1 hypothetical protein MGG_12488 [Pyricularia oryzae 70-15]EHA56034.1 hypothetical protein MGG_08246 [Pyricularia oryzae 70-15]
MHFFQNTTTLAQLTLKPTAKALKAAMNIACDILMEIAEKAAKLIPRLVGQAVKLSSEAVDGAKFLAEKVGENIPDAATQIAQDIPTNYGKAAAVILGISGIAMVAAPAVLTLPALGAVGFSASRPIAGEFGYWGKTFRNGDKQSARRIRLTAVDGSSSRGAYVQTAELSVVCNHGDEVPNKCGLDGTGGWLLSIASRVILATVSGEEVEGAGFEPTLLK